jgi:hypothetical protein
MVKCLKKVNIQNLFFAKSILLITPKILNLAKTKRVKKLNLINKIRATKKKIKRILRRKEEKIKRKLTKVLLAR